MADRNHDPGYDLALETVLAVAARESGRLPVVSPICSMVTVQVISTMQHAFEQAA